MVRSTTCLAGVVMMVMACGPVEPTGPDAGSAGGRTGGGSAAGGSAAGGSAAGGSAAGGSAAGGSAAGGSAAGGSAAGGSAAGGSAAGGSAAGGSAGGTAGGGGTSTIQRYGEIIITQSSFDLGGTTFTSGSVFANFGDVPPGAPTCTTQMVAGCEVLNCPAAGPDAGVPPLLSAGTLTVSGFGASSTSIQPDANNAYFQIIQGAQFSPGMSVQVQATGASVPAFSVQGAAPSAIQVLTPACMLSSCGSISRSSGLTATWMPVSTGSMLVRVGSGTSAVSCLFPASAGSGQVPAAAMAGLPTGMGAISLGGGTISMTQAGPYRVRLSLISGGGAPVTITP